MVIFQLSPKEIKFENSILFNNIKGKMVIAKSGEELGKVSDIVMKEYIVVGVIIKRFFKKNLFIASDYFDSFKENAILLSINPVSELIGLEVFDKNGRKLGKVKKIMRASTRNSISEFVVKKGLFSKTKTFSSSNIATVSENIILGIITDEN